MAQDEKRALWYIKKIPLFQDVSHDTIHKLVQCVELKEVRRRQVVYLPGDPGQAVYFVNGGRVKISKVTRDGKELTLAYRGPGEIFGELVMIDGGPREEMAEAMENALITEIDRAEFEKIVQKEGVIGFRLDQDRLAAPPRRRKQDRAAHLQGRQRQAGRAAPAAGRRVRRRRQPRHAGLARRSRTRRWPTSSARRVRRCR